jgi:hypothetical protein
MSNRNKERIATAPSVEKGAVPAFPRGYGSPGSSGPSGVLIRIIWSGACHI